jgi:hypothetical protein
MAIVSGSKISTGLPQMPEGVPQQLYTHFFAVYNAIHNLERFISLYGGVDAQPSDLWSQLTVDDSIFDGNLNRWYVPAYEILSYGQAVSPILDSGVLKVRLANATNNTKWCCGFVNSVGSFAAGEYVEVLTRGLIAGVSGMTVGSRYWLSTTNGSITNVAPAASGNIQQVVGFAMASNRLLCNLDSYFITVP